jgi:signal peptidase II
MYLGQSIPVFGNWFQIRFIENPGMAFGLDIPGKFGKIALTGFRMIAIVGIIWYLKNLIQKNANTFLVICISMILAGAVGNLLDSLFYGWIFDKGTIYDAQIGRWVGYGGIAHANFAGYAAPFKGCVVDWIYFPLIEGTYPNWFPLKGGESFIFFRPIFNIADSAISVGVILILLFQKKLFKDL